MLINISALYKPPHISTKTTGELCAGVVKAQAIYSKNPAQHYADLKMLSTIPELQPAFLNPHTNEPKLIECIRVDGAGDEGPAHEEVMFWWTVRHLENGNLVTLLTSRSSGSSYLNRVELQNSCLAQGHSNIFIPSTLNGACFNEETGKIDQDRLKTNMESAMDVYIACVSGCPCGDTLIHLYKGADSSEFQCMRRHANFPKRIKEEERSIEAGEAFHLFVLKKNVGCKTEAYGNKSSSPVPISFSVLFFRLSTPKMSKWTILFIFRDYMVSWWPKHYLDPFTSA